jgi:predicted small lipoprotein YifL
LKKTESAIQPDVRARLARMRALRRTAILLLIAQACGAGCGLKGPLYLPTAEEEREMAERERALEERERRERKGQPAPAAPAPATPAPPPPPSTQSPAQVNPGSLPTN